MELSIHEVKEGRGKGKRWLTYFLFLRPFFPTAFHHLFLLLLLLLFLLSSPIPPPVVRYRIGDKSWGKKSVRGVPFSLSPIKARSLGETSAESIFRILSLHSPLRGRQTPLKSKPVGSLRSYPKTPFSILLLLLLLLLLQFLSPPFHPRIRDSLQKPPFSFSSSSLILPSPYLKDLESSQKNMRFISPSTSTERNIDPLCHWGANWIFDLCFPFLPFSIHIERRSMFRLFLFLLFSHEAYTPPTRPSLSLPSSLSKALFSPQHSVPPRAAQRKQLLPTSTATAKINLLHSPRFRS